MATVALVGTLDTKGADFAFLAGRLRAAGAEVVVVDAGTGEPAGLRPDVDGDAVA
ncbi:MAG: Tm-1-like ATP-binding domain-containing protein, partial [Nocardiopsaceae bacterium]|nr:Tm-1-like ATP-binding domain-containing protein [Nocardiopsaceae bacterium]